MALMWFTVIHGVKRPAIGMKDVVNLHREEGIGLNFIRRRAKQAHGIAAVMKRKHADDSVEIVTDPERDTFSLGTTPKIL